MRTKLLYKIRRQTQLLVVSGTLNILTLSYLTYWYFRECPPTPICEKKPVFSKEYSISSESSDLINFFSGLPFEDLLPYLKNTIPLDSGYSLRDLALGCLFTHHHLDISRALSSYKPLQKVFFNYIDSNKTKQQIILHPGFNDYHFELIQKFIQKEKWPFTSQGLFEHLKNNLNDKNLQYAFFITPEFMTVELLLKRKNSSLEKEEILSLLLQGDWEILSDFFASQRVNQDLSDDKRDSFLRTYLEKGCSKASVFLFQEPQKEVLKTNISKKFFSDIKPWKKVYTVVEGDSLWKISRRFQIDVQELKNKNGLNKDVLQPGTTLIVP